MGRQSSVRGDFVHVKTTEVGKLARKKKKIGKKIGELKFAKKKNWQTGKK